MVEMVVVRQEGFYALIVFCPSMLTISRPQQSRSRVFTSLSVSPFQYRLILCRILKRNLTIFFVFETELRRGPKPRQQTPESETTVLPASALPSSPSFEISLPVRGRRDALVEIKSACSRSQVTW